MKKFGRRIMALTLAGAMMCAPMTAFAEEVSSPVQDTVTGSGSVEDIIEMDIFKVVLPTVSVTSGDTTTSVLDFILDPQKLLKTTDTSSTYSDSTLFFANAPTGGGSTTTYSATSDALTITNKSTHAIDVYLDASVSGLADSGLGLATASTWSDNDETDEIDESKAKELYLAVMTAKKAVDASDFTPNGSATAITSSGFEGTAITLAQAKDGSYELKKNTDGDYSYTLKASAAETDFAHMNVQFTGSCNSAADWTTTDATLAPKLNLTWTIVKQGAGKDSITPAAAAPTFTTGDTIGTINYSVGSGDDALASIEKIELTLDGTIFDGYNASTYWAAATDSNNTITFDTPFINCWSAVASTDATITYTTVGGETKTATVTVKTQ